MGESKIILDLSEENQTKNIDSIANGCKPEFISSRADEVSGYISPEKEPNYINKELEKLIKEIIDMLREDEIDETEDIAEDTYLQYFQDCYSIKTHHPKIDSVITIILRLIKEDKGIWEQESRIRNREEELENLVKLLIANTGVPESYIKEDVDPEAFKKAMYNSLVLEGYIPKNN